MKAEDGGDQVKVLHHLQSQKSSTSSTTAHLSPAAAPRRERLQTVPPVQTLIALHHMQNVRTEHPSGINPSESSSLELCPGPLATLRKQPVSNILGGSQIYTC